ncbi:MAG: hypothetical protein ABI193_14785, partial [Minicystis sp.]
MKTTWIPRAALLSLISISAVLAGCGEVPSYDALSSDPSGDAPSNKDPGGVDPGHEGIDLDPSAGDVRHVPLDPGATPGSGAPGTKEVLTCVLIAPTTNGAVRDTSLVELDEQPHGQDGSAMTGHVGRARAQMLLRFELPIPKEGKVRSAVVTLHHVGNGTESVR